PSASQTQAVESLVPRQKSEVAQKARVVVARVARLAHRPVDSCDEFLDDGIPANETERGWLDYGQRAHRVRIAGRGEQRHDSAVGVTDEVRTVSQQLCDVRGLTLEVDASLPRAAAE